MIKPDEIDVNDKAEDLINDHFVEGSDLKKFTHAEQSDKVCTCCDMLVMEIDKNKYNSFRAKRNFGLGPLKLLINVLLLCSLVSFVHASGTGFQVCWQYYVLCQ